MDTTYSQLVSAAYSYDIRIAMVQFNITFVDNLHNHWIQDNAYLSDIELRLSHVSSVVEDYNYQLGSWPDASSVRHSGD